VDQELQEFYGKLVAAIDNPVFRGGQWKLCEHTGWIDNATYQNIVAWRWERDGERYLIVVNLSEHPAQAHIHAGWNDLAGQTWTLNDALSGVTYERSGDEMLAPGLYVDLAPWGCHFMSWHRSSKVQRRKDAAP
jgi:hypothetical protein